jgi:hypothetical protein
MLSQGGIIEEGMKLSISYEGTSALPDVAYCPAHQKYEYHDYGFPHEHWYVYQRSAVQWSRAMAQHPIEVETMEHCRSCLQPLIATTDGGIDYCPNCGRFQRHRF